MDFTTFTHKSIIQMKTTTLYNRKDFDGKQYDSNSFTHLHDYYYFQ